MRAIVLALVFAVSPMGPGLCALTCAVQATGQTQNRGMPLCHETHAAPTGAALDNAHPCVHADGTLLAVPPNGSLTSQRLGIRPSMTAFALRTDVTTRATVPSASNSPPSQFPPIISLRI